MIHRSRFIGRFTTIAIAVLLGLVLGTSAQARSEVLRWTHTSPSDVVRFEAHVGSESRSYQKVVNLGMPEPNVDGIYEAAIEVGEGDDIFVALRAVGPDAQSPLSNERVRESSTSRPSTSIGQTASVGSGTPLAASAGPDMRMDFSTFPKGAAVAGWFDTGANNSRVEDDSLFHVRSLSGNLVLKTSSDANHIHSHLMGSGAPWSDSIYRGRMAVTDSNSSVGVTSHSQYPSADVYYRFGRGAGEPFQIRGHPSFTCAGGVTSVLPEPGAWYFFELAVTDEGNATRIRAKVWREGESEPSAPQAECVDSRASRSTGGTVGVWAAGPGEKYWDDLEVVSPASMAGGAPEPPVLIQVVPAK